LNYYHNEVKKHIICTFNAASNVTGIRTDVDSISTLVHKYDGWIFWDYAAAAPYLEINMNSSTTSFKDAVFISTHKFIGGPGAPGILIAKKNLFTNKIPNNCGGGTVNFVTRTQIEYIKDIETREEGGTPDILGSIRAGLVFHLKESVGHHFIESREDELVKKFFQHFKNHKTLRVLGSSSVSRLAIFSFLIYVPQFKKFLHHHFICVLLNDLFGIQIRSGCSCAGPYVLVNKKKI
jgi:selenocysteine lyase/cysteine desulfurase